MIRKPDKFKFLNAYDIRLWIGLFVIIQAFFITQPPLEPAHAWRQCLTNMVARNLAEKEGNLFYPTIDYGGESKGIMGTEFPVFQSLIASFYTVFGTNHWMGRAINLLISCCGFYAFYLLIIRYFNHKHALFSTLALMFSLWLMYSRKSMPDTFSVSIVLVSFYYYSVFFDTKNWGYLLLAMGLLCMGILSKIPALLVVVPLPFLLMRKEVGMGHKLALILSVFVASLPVIWWYFTWVPYLVGLDNNPLFFPRTLAAGWQEIQMYPAKMLEQFTFHSFFSFVGFGLFLMGLVYMIKKRQWIGLSFFTASGVVMFLFILKTGMVFPIHSYYMIPFVPIMAFSLGYFLSQLRSTWAWVLIGVVFIESLSNQQDDFRIRDNMFIYMQLEEIANGIGKSTDKIVCNGGDNPQMIYFLNRKGWSLNNEEIQSDTLSHIYQKGGKYFYQLSVLGQEDNELPFKVVKSTPYLRVYDLSLPTKVILLND